MFIQKVAREQVYPWRIELSPKQKILESEPISETAEKLPFWVFLNRRRFLGMARTQFQCGNKWAAIRT